MDSPRAAAYAAIVAWIAIAAPTGAVHAQEGELIPAWVKSVFAYYIDGQITEVELINALQYLIDQNIIQVSAAGTPAPAAPAAMSAEASYRLQAESLELASRVTHAFIDMASMEPYEYATLQERVDSVQELAAAMDAADAAYIAAMRAAAADGTIAPAEQDAIESAAAAAARATRAVTEAIVEGVDAAAAISSSPDRGAADAAAAISSSPDRGAADMSAMRGTVSTAFASPALGDPDAPVTIIEFGDYQCHQCYNWFHNTRPKISSEYIETGRASLVFVDMAFLGRDSPRAAEASHCADDQGMYWEYHNTLYRQQGSNIDGGWAADERLALFASSIGLDADQFEECLGSGKHRDRVEYNTNEAIRHGVDGTPTFIIVGPGGDEQTIVGAQPYGVFRDAIEAAA